MPNLNKIAKEDSKIHGYYFIPLGLKHKLMTAGMVKVASQIQEPDEVYVAISTGVLSRALQIAWPNAKFTSVAVARNLHKNTTFIVDEASMIAGDTFDQHYGSNNLLEDLLSYVFGGDNCKLIFMGDTAQLPPVGTALSPALNNKYLKSTYDFSIGMVELTDVVRQNLDSGILLNATSIRNQLSIQNDVFPKLNIDFPDVMSITGIELEEELETAYGKFGEDDMQGKE